MGGSTTTKVEQAPPSAEERAYLTSQQELAAKQLEILGRQDDFNQSYLQQIKPVLDATLKVQQQQLDAAMNPVQNEIDNQIRAQQLQSLKDNADLAPIQKQLLMKQLDDLSKPVGTTPEEAALIDQATGSALASGRTAIDSFTQDNIDRLRTSLAPGLGLRPSDTPIIDRGGLIAQDAGRQYGKLVSDLSVANASEKLNYPLNRGQLSLAQDNFSAGLKDATGRFQAALQDAAATNRARLMASGSDFIGQGTQTGIGLVTGSRGNPLSFSRGSTSTTEKGFGLGDLLGTAGGIMTGLGSLGVRVSDERTKENIRLHHTDTEGRRWYSFNYKGQPKSQRTIGVMAQEVEKTEPEAVLTNGIGLKMVDYDKLRAA